MKSSIRVGCAGWSIPKEQSHYFPNEGAHLARYSALFSVVEINSSFYRLHRENSYHRWAYSVPKFFQFSVKIPREITHNRCLKSVELLNEFLKGPAMLGDKLGPLLVQLPPKLAFDRHVADAFFIALRKQFKGHVVCEPRHSSWFSAEAQSLLEHFEIGRVAVDPAPVPEAADPGGWRDIIYFRLHGSPEMYRSSYSEEFLSKLVSRLQQEFMQQPVWCIFDNTARGAAIPNAIWVLNKLRVGNVGWFSQSLTKA